MRWNSRSFQIETAPRYEERTKCKSILWLGAGRGAGRGAPPRVPQLPRGPTRSVHLCRERGISHAAEALLSARVCVCVFRMKRAGGAAACALAGRTDGVVGGSAVCGAVLRRGRRGGRRSGRDGRRDRQVLRARARVHGAKRCGRDSHSVSTYTSILLSREIWDSFLEICIYVSSLRYLVAIDQRAEEPRDTCAYL